MPSFMRPASLISIEYYGVLLVAAPVAQLEKSAGLFVDLAHRNQTNVSCDAQIRRSWFSAASSSRHLRSPLAMEEQRTAGSW